MMGECPWQLNILSEKIARFVQFNRKEYSMSEELSPKVGDGLIF